MAWSDTLQAFRNMVNALHYQGAPINSIKPEQQNPVFQKIGDALADHANDTEAHGAGGLPTGANGSMLVKLEAGWGVLLPGTTGQQLKYHTVGADVLPYAADADIALDLYVEHGGYCYPYYYTPDEFTRTPYFACKNVYLRDNASKKKVYLQVGAVKEFVIPATGYLFINIADFIAAVADATILLRRDNAAVTNANYMLSAMDIPGNPDDIEMRFVSGKLVDLANQFQLANKQYTTVTVAANVATVNIFRNETAMQRFLVAHSANVAINTITHVHLPDVDGFIRVKNTHATNAITATFGAAFSTLAQSIPAQKTMLFYFCKNSDGDLVVYPVVSEVAAAGVQNKYDATAAPAVGNDNTQGYAVGSRWIDVTNDNIYDCVDATTGAAIWVKSNFEVFSFALSDYATALTTGVKDALNIPYACKLIDLFIAVADAPTGASLIVDLKKNATSIFTTKPSIDATEKTSLTAATPFVLTGAITFVKGDEVSGHIDQIGATNAGKALKVYLILDRK